MKEERNNNIDKLFLTELEGHSIEPSAGIWQSLEKHIPSIGGSGIIMFLFTAIAIGAISTFLLFGLNHSENQDIAANIYDSTNMPAEKLSIETSNTSNTLMTTDIEDAIPVQHTDPELKPSPSQVTVAEDTQEAKSEEKPFRIQAVQKSSLLVDNATQEDEVIVIYTHIDRLKYRPGTIILPASEEVNTTTMREASNPVYDLSINDSYVKKADVLFGAGISPAVNFYPDGQNRNDFSFDLVAAYEKSRFIVEGGIGANYTSESAEYRINYSSYDSVGYYLGVSSFIIDPSNPDSIIRETNLKGIYDSIDHYSINENTNKFAYLQIPIKLGYRVIQKDRFSLDLKLGVIFSVQIYKDVPETPYSGNDVEIEVIRQYPDRLTTTWQYTAGAAFNYQINRQLRFSLEPFYRQYLKSVYTSGSPYSARSPYSFGIRAGLYIHF